MGSTSTRRNLRHQEPRKCIRNLPLGLFVWVCSKTDCLCDFSAWTSKKWATPSTGVVHMYHHQEWGGWNFQLAERNDTESSLTFACTLEGSEIMVPCPRSKYTSILALACSISFLTEIACHYRGGSACQCPGGLARGPRWLDREQQRLLRGQHQGRARRTFRVVLRADGGAARHALLDPPGCRQQRRTGSTRLGAGRNGPQARDYNDRGVGERSG